MKELWEAYQETARKTDSTLAKLVLFGAVAWMMPMAAVFDALEFVADTYGKWKRPSSKGTGNEKGER